MHMTTNVPLANNHISVDCVVLGFDGEQLKVLLLKRSGEDDGKYFHDMKLPGSLIYMDEDLDEAAHRVLFQLTGLKNVTLMEFKAFGSKNRTRNPRDVKWLENAIKQRVDRIVTVAYISVVKLDSSLENKVIEHGGCWIPLNDVAPLAFDHNLIISAAMTYIRQHSKRSPELLFKLLPRKFTALQLRTIFELIYGKPEDVRNFHKKIARMDYVVPLEEKQQGVPHRAARFYKFDKKLYNRARGV